MFTLFLVSAVCGLLLYFVLRFKQKLNYWQSRGIACEEPNWILGNIAGAGSTRSFHEVWSSYYKRFKGTGPFAGFYSFYKPVVFVLETSLIKNILIKDFNKFADRGFFSNTKDDPLTGTLFLLDGQKWKSLRSKLSPTFTSGKMKFMFPTVHSLAQDLVQVFGEKLQETSVVEMKNIVGRFTMDVIGNCAFGIDCNSLKSPDAEFLTMGKKAFTDFRYGTLGVAFTTIFPDLARTLHIKQTPDYIENFYMRIVRETVELREKHKVRRNDFMDMLIDLTKNQIVKPEDGQDLTNLTLEEIAAQAFLFLAAGFDTSSTTMGFAIYELAQHEDLQQRAREEVNSVLEQHEGEFTYECMKDMQYLDQVISETLRLYTVLPIINRKCLEDYVVPGHPNYVIKQGMNVIIPSGAIHRDADYYPNPDTFNPDNFSPELVKQRDSVEWLPFGEGPRNCIGMRFGLMQVRVGLAMLLKKFKFSVCPQTQIPIKYDKTNIVIASESGIYLKVENL